MFKCRLLFALSVLLLAACQHVGSESPSGAGGGTFTQPAPAPAPAQANVSDWLTYSNAQYGFSVQYPREYAAIPARDSPKPAPLTRVWFLESALLNSETLNFEVPKLAVDVFDNSAGQSLDAWLAANIASAPAERSTTQVGGVNALRLASMTMALPNVFYYVAHNRFVYRFTPGGGFGDQMVETVSFAN